MNWVNAIFVSSQKYAGRILSSGGNYDVEVNQKFILSPDIIYAAVKELI
jgi:hypothetical protein